ncbi:MAG: TIGR00730 family Rossman fold protein [Actinomycetota bacterium]|nr:TIGR00730 family Rossman fold protein [Actinomycetota bacterium]
MSDRRAAICVFCASSDKVPAADLELAAAVGREIARRGHVLVTGGGRVSCMGAVARAARAAGGLTVGVIPQALLDREVADHDADELVVTADMRERKGEMDRRSDAFLALPGGLGTLEELLEVWVARSLGMHAKPVVVLDPLGMFEPLRGQVESLEASGFVRAEALDAVIWTTTVDEALDAIAGEWARDAVPRIPEPEELLEAEP